MAVSQNGWSANQADKMATYTVVPGIRVTLRRGDASVVLLDFLRRYHAEVEPLKQKDLGGYAPRKIRGGSSLSNHASGTAVDTRWQDHPLSASGTFSAKEKAALLRILKDFDGILRWGGNYSGRKDEMHTEINAGSAKVKKVADRIRKNGTSKKTSAPKPVSKPSTPKKYVKVTSDLKLGSKGEQVNTLQHRFGIKEDGEFGPGTEAKVKTWQRNHNLTPDGLVGPRTRKSLGL